MMLMSSAGNRVARNCRISSRSWGMSAVAPIGTAGSTARLLSVKELPWCAPSDSPVRRAKQTKAESRNNTDDNSTVTKPIDRFGVVVAISKNRVIGMDGGIPWRVPKDRRIFKALTDGTILVVGKRTFEEHPNLVHVNHSRVCIVVSRSMEQGPVDTAEAAPNTEIKLARSLEEALEIANTLETDIQMQNSSTEDDKEDPIACWIAGGEKIYEEALRHPSVAEIHVSEIDVEVEISTASEVARFPAKYRWDNKFEIADEKVFPGDETSLGFRYRVYRRKPRY